MSNPSVGPLLAALVCGWSLGALAEQQTPAAGPGQDVGLVTRIEGAATCRSARSKTATGITAFMKLRLGDRIEASAQASVQLIYFKTGRQERWQGPACWQIDAGQSRPLDKRRPEVSLLPVRASNEVRRISNILDKRMGLTRPGSGANRSLADDLASSPLALSEEERLEIEQARQAYLTLKKQLAPSDITPELMLIGALYSHEQYGQAAEVAEAALALQPGNPALEELCDILAAMAPAAAAP